MKRRSAHSWGCCGSEGWQEAVLCSWWDSARGCDGGFGPAGEIEGRSPLKYPLSRLPDICSSDKLQSTDRGREQNWAAFIEQSFRLSLEFIAASCLRL